MTTQVQQMFSTQRGQQSEFFEIAYVLLDLLLTMIKRSISFSWFQDLGGNQVSRLNEKQETTFLKQPNHMSRQALQSTNCQQHMLKVWSVFLVTTSGIKVSLMTMI